MTTLRDQLATLRRDLSYAQSHLTDLTTALESTGLLDKEIRTPRPGSPRELHTDACPQCEIVAGHTTDCPALYTEVARRLPAVAD